ncbi:MAG: dockerin type I repeat-containing protein, partial [Ruminococcus sp.]|nr:dockerin type I repeat-containing protein [Ruminococcus sp.]
IADKWIDYCSVGLMTFDSYIFDNKNDIATFENYLSDNNIAYEKYESVSNEMAEIVLEQYIETSDGEVKQVYTNDEYFELLQKIKADTGFTVSWVSPASNIEITNVVNALPEVTLAGDANEDGEVNISDAVLIMQSIANPEEFALTLQGRANADIYGDGVTLMDALTIQEMSLNKSNA